MMKFLLTWRRYLHFLKQVLPEGFLRARSVLRNAGTAMGKQQLISYLPRKTDASCSKLLFRPYFLICRNLTALVKFRLGCLLLL